MGGVAVTYDSSNSDAGILRDAGSTSTTASTTSTTTTSSGHRAKAYNGQCTAADEAEMQKLGGGSHVGSFPRAIEDCRYRIYSAQAMDFFNPLHDLLAQDCVRGTTRISEPCAKCFSEGYACGSECFWGDRCSDKCLSCTAKHYTEYTEDCVGLDV